MKTFIINSEFMGIGDDKLGAKLTISFFRKLGLLNQQPDFILLYNSGVKLMSKDSPILNELQILFNNGVEILGCGTCITSYKLDEKINVGQISTMHDIVSVMTKSDSVITI
ncbi:MAG: sulfurtransferase-like selenium metabolism protein YedF [Candidatus Marinimicrobia bacterium]|nr:sulfurtransferase-like selenium metabolism protein YedF [Candidatus Neomarinimicrobiota bacterium]MBL7022926.1 sulfurtransferase-like selenium metabolism protein YedF [Candidatus Neomarinimicrobiota bacterium]MBL7108744.1 sulfurtransferase-like selenium metabolism protein YedF [Candidatus Neomarinimicrobiota bacterium]